MSIKRAAGVAPIYKNSILLAKRTEFWGKEKTPVPLGGYWSIFAGSLEKNENPMVCAVRELKEETQISTSIEHLKYIKTIQEPNLELTIYALELEEMILPVLNEEHIEYGWFDIHELDSFPDKIDEKMVNCINLYKKTKFNT